MIELGIALLEGGNQDIQKTFFSQLQCGDTSQNFFKVFHTSIYDAQSEIKNTVTVNTSDIGKKYARKKYDQFVLNNSSCYLGK